MGKPCSCDVCKQMCHHQPCLPTPGDMLKVMLHDNEHGTKYCTKFEVINLYGFDMIRPKRAVAGPCTFLTPANMCSLHNVGLKPTEGAEVDCNTTPDESRKIHNHVAAQWSVVGSSILKLYREKTK